jgi:hypothetical protein
MRLVLLALLLVCGLTSAVAAQPLPQGSEASAAPAPPNPAAIMPPALTAPAASAAPAANPSPLSNIFPTLPPSAPCKPGDLWGYYRLEKLYEQPAGGESADFRAAPLQFFHFAANGTYRPLKLAQRMSDRKAFYESFNRKEGDPLTQYAVHEGFVYFYNEGQHIDTMACFIVANDVGEFKKGRLLLMPPAPQDGQEATARVLRVYHNFNRPRGRPPHAKKATP